MIIDSPPENVTEKILILGRRESCLYLVNDNDEYTMLGGGTGYIIPEVLDQLERFNIPEEKIIRMIILHSHFDHCGLIPFFKKRWPWAVISASERAKALLSNPKITQSIDQLNQFLIASYGRQDEAKNLGIGFSGIDVEQVLKDGDVVMCGNMRLKILEVPGHSSCSIAVYIPEERALFASDAGGIPFGDDVFTAANSNIDQYMTSLDKMGKYEVDIFLAEHFGARIGSEGRKFLQKAKVSALETRKILEASYIKTRSVEQSSNEITDLLMKNRPVDFFPKEVISLVVSQMLAYISKNMDS